MRMISALVIGAGSVDTEMVGACARCSCMDLVPALPKDMRTSLVEPDVIANENAVPAWAQPPLQRPGRRQSCPSDDQTARSPMLPT